MTLELEIIALCDITRSSNPDFGLETAIREDFAHSETSNVQRSLRCQDQL